MKETNELYRCRPQLGTYVEVRVQDVCGKSVLIQRTQVAFDRIQELSDTLSFHRPQSELSMVNQRAHLKPLSISSDLAKVLSLGLKLSKLTQGQYDLTIAPSLVKRGLLPSLTTQPDETATWEDIVLEGNQVFFRKPLWLDLGGIAKGYAVDCGFELLSDLEAVLVNAGGDLRMNPWKGQEVLVRDPRLKGKGFKPVQMDAAALATSSGYTQPKESPFVNQRTGRPIKISDSFSVFAESCMLADALTKVMILAPEPERILSTFSATSFIFPS